MVPFFFFLSRPPHLESEGHVAARVSKLNCHGRTEANSAGELHGHWPLLLRDSRVGICRSCRPARDLRRSPLGFLNCYAAVFLFDASERSSHEKCIRQSSHDHLRRRNPMPFRRICLPVRKLFAELVRHSRRDVRLGSAPERS